MNYGLSCREAKINNRMFKSEWGRDWDSLTSSTYCKKSDGPDMLFPSNLLIVCMHWDVVTAQHSPETPVPLLLCNFSSGEGGARAVAPLHGPIAEKCVLKYHLGWQNTLNCLLGWQNTLNCLLVWLKHDKLPSWVAKTCLGALLVGKIQLTSLEVKTHAKVHLLVGKTH